jgi:hypothetical protein
VKFLDPTETLTPTPRSFSPYGVAVPTELSRLRNKIIHQNNKVNLILLQSELNRDFFVFVFYELDGLVSNLHKLQISSKTYQWDNAA